ncbi:6590_t:CDS:1 [Acaulospora colombiana]|uniref:6590_t:CDS:1 n=1 Tax=Acaulospora colombiana TaxID=27376 RepID=A0ACA9QHZ7_9GLOM|nr:6590_t:CDS:1 [Acaulospora colombiana]
MTDQILDYVWDYGCLKSEDERNYINIMVKAQLGHPYFAELLYASQEFIRNVEEPFSVSLRDVKRAIKLFKFFRDSYKNLIKILNRDSHRNLKNSLNSVSNEARSIVLALGTCYLFRLHDQSKRRNYRNEMIEIIKKHDKNFPKQSKFSNKDSFEFIIQSEQEAYVKCYPDGTAWNEALFENILVMIVCIQTRIPVFIIGAPGR